MKKLLISVNEFCETVDIGRTYAAEMIRQNTVSSIRLGGRRLIVMASVEALIERLLNEQTRIRNANEKGAR